MDSTNNVQNNEPVTNQINANQVRDIFVSPLSRLAQRFKRLQEEVQQNQTVEDFLDDFKYYNTELDGRSMPDKLQDGGFNSIEIRRATLRKHKYWKKMEKNKFYETAQKIDLEIFSFINHNFESYIEPLIEKKANTSEIKLAVREKVVNPICELLNEHGAYDDFLNYDMDDIYGMIFFLTGKCHLNWTIYDNV
ncbi:ABC-three component system protein [Pedobacter psychrodurus]|uniref:ABC-three component system protein n=1 Tax=Pedobacter psychrodurus TaxID=2530456 RepID=UPI0012159924|nr:ABC-three component system protein [Pedobacter psychrodurus]RZJ42313.1 MAG: hypothetical protein EOO19_13740 [Chryseobacterium sp.]